VHVWCVCSLKLQSTNMSWTTHTYIMHPSGCASSSRRQAYAFIAEAHTCWLRIAHLVCACCSWEQPGHHAYGDKNNSKQANVAHNIAVHMSKCSCIGRRTVQMSQTYTWSLLRLDSLFAVLANTRWTAWSLRWYSSVSKLHMRLCST